MPNPQIPIRPADPMEAVPCGKCRRRGFTIGLGLDSEGLFVECLHCGHRNRPAGGVVWVAAP